MSEYDTLDLIASVLAGHAISLPNEENFKLQANIFVIALFQSLANKRTDLKKNIIDEILQHYVKRIDAKLSKNQVYLGSRGFIDEDKTMGYSVHEILATKIDIDKFDKVLKQDGSLDNATLQILKEFLYTLYIEPFGRYDEEDYFEGDRHFSDFLNYKMTFLNNYLLAKSAINNLLNTLT